MSNSTRALALQWWRNLSPDEQQSVAKKNFPTMDFVLVTTSSSRIEQMWEKLNDRKFTYDDLFKAFVAGDTEGMRRGDEVDREEFEEWYTDFIL